MNGGELVAAQAGDELTGRESLAHAVGDGDQHLVAGAVAADVVDFLEAVEIDDDQREAGAAAVGARDVLVETVGEARAVRQACEGIVQRHVAQLAERIAAGLIVNQVAGQAGADDQQADDGDGQGQGFHGGRIGVAGRDIEGMNVDGRHAGEMQADDRQD